MEINNLSNKDVEKIKNLIEVEIKPSNPLVNFRIYDTRVELKSIIKEAVREVLQEVDIMKEYKKITQQNSEECGGK